MNFIYPAICHFENGGYWCEFPDLDGCFSQGDNEKEIIMNAKESLEGYIISILENEKELPKASNIKDIEVGSSDFVTYINCDISDTAKSVRKNVTIPLWLEKKAEKARVNFSQVLQEALCQKLDVAF